MGKKGKAELWAIVKAAVFTCLIKGRVEVLQIGPALGLRPQGPSRGLGGEQSQCLQAADRGQSVSLSGASFLVSGLVSKSAAFGIPWTWMDTGYPIRGPEQITTE